MTSPARSALTQAELAGINGRGLGEQTGSGKQPLIDSTNLDADILDSAGVQATILQFALASKLKFVTVVGVDGDPGPTDLTVTGLESGDVLLAVLDGGNVAQALSHFEVNPGKLRVSTLDMGAFEYVVVFVDVNAVVTI